MKWDQRVSHYNAYDAYVCMGCQRKIITNYFYCSWCVDPISWGEEFGERNALGYLHTSWGGTMIWEPDEDEYPEMQQDT